ncbi:MAG: FAD:protein FMN transferase, partial [Alphaproteobacteria bacterium]
GHIETPAADLLNLLSSSSRFGDQTNGAFDVTVQPLWLLFSEHFSKQPGIQTGPSNADIKSALDLVDYRKIDITGGRVHFAKPGMAVTLNGIAQGYITDRVADLLRDQGISQVLVELGETRALDDHPDGRPWRIGLASPQDPNQTTETIELVDESVATSAGSGTILGGGGRYHHLFDPRTGKPATHHVSASVITKRAATADAMSTALFVLPTSQIEDIVQKIGGMKAVTTSPDGVKHRFVS